jgi:hypothetical protein
MNPRGGCPAASTVEQLEPHSGLDPRAPVRSPVLERGIDGDGEQAHSGTPRRIVVWTAKQSSPYLIP